MKIFKKALVTGFALALLSNPFALTKTQATDTTKGKTLQEKIELYKNFKKTSEDKDFRLKSYPVKRTESTKEEAYFFNNYFITYGIVEDNARGYIGNHKQYYKTKDGDWYQVDYNKMVTNSKTTHIKDIGNIPYPLALVFNILSKEELGKIVSIYEFNDGDIDIRFNFGEESDKKIVEPIYQKLKDADEKNDKKKSEVKMEPIIPTKNQWLPFNTLMLDEDKNGEPEYALIPSCIDGSYFDNDPYNNDIQVCLKYRLITKEYLEGKTEEEKKKLEENMGCWIWKRPSEILISFDKTRPGPEIIFYDIGKVVDGKVIDEEPDGKFDKYEFLD